MSSFTANLMQGWQSWMHLFGNDPVTAAGAALVVFVFTAGLLRLWTTSD